MQALREWLARQRTMPALNNLICLYLRARGRKTLRAIAPPGPRFSSLVRDHDRLGWRNFLEGRICQEWLILQADHYRQYNIRRGAAKWARGLMLRLLQITHRQWTYRNSTVHIKVNDDLTEAQQLALMSRCEELLWTDPDSLLREDRVLLDADFQSLGSGSAYDRQLWAAEMVSSLAAADRSTSEPPPIDTEGSIRYRRRRRHSSAPLTSE